MKLLCPICHEPLHRQDRQFCDARRHSFDCAKSGYVNLLVGKQTNNTGDNKLMIQSRSQFLEKGFYHVLLDAVNAQIHQFKPTTLVDLACGQGYYTRQMEVADKVGIDLSKEALIYAAKHDTQTQYVLASIFHLPLADNSVDWVSVLFAPHPWDEAHRILKKDGIFLLVTPAEDHLFGLKEILYEQPYLNQLETDADERFVCIHEEIVRDTITLNQEEIRSCFRMTPYYYKTSKQSQEKLAQQPQLTTPISFYLRYFKKK